MCYIFFDLNLRRGLYRFGAYSLYLFPTPIFLAFLWHSCWLLIHLFLCNQLWNRGKSIFLTFCFGIACTFCFTPFSFVRLLCFGVVLQSVCTALLVILYIKLFQRNSYSYSKSSIAKVNITFNMAQSTVKRKPLMRLVNCNISIIRQHLIMFSFSFWCQLNWIKSSIT